MKAVIIYIIFFSILHVSSFAQHNQYTSTKFAVKNPYEVFIGGIMKANDVNGLHQLLNVPMNPITISYSLPLKSETIIPSYDNMLRTIQQKLQENNVLKPNYQFSFTLKQIDSYEQLALFFGEEIDLSDLFKITSPNPIHKTVAVLDISQSYFSIAMDMPEEELSNSPIVQEQLSELIYVGSIEFGRRSILIVESDLNYQDVKVALNEILNKSTTKKGDISEKSKSIMASSIIRGLILNPLANENITPDNPLEYLLDYINSDISPNDFGVPIFFTAAWLKDNSVFVNKFTN